MMIWKNEMTYHMYISHARLSTHDVPGVRESARDAKTKQNVPRLAFERPKPHEREHRRVHERHDELFKSPMFPALVQPLDVLWSHRHRRHRSVCCLFFFFFFSRGFVCRFCCSKERREGKGIGFVARGGCLPLLRRAQKRRFRRRLMSFYPLHSLPLHGGKSKETAKRASASPPASHPSQPT